MSLGIFTITDVNPNVAQGGGGCLCAEDYVPDCKPPFVVFHAVDMFSPYSPHAVICAECIGKCQIQLERGDFKPEAVDTTAEYDGEDVEPDEEDIPEV